MEIAPYLRDPSLAPKASNHMLAIVLSACLANQPSVCRDYKIPIKEGIDAMHCMQDAPPYFAQWNEEHPGWQIKRWRCAPTSENDI